MTTKQRSLNYIRKLERPEIKALGDGHFSIVVSTETKDRDGDIIRVAGWNLENFNKNPVLLDSHRYDSVTDIIGQWVDMQVKNKQLVGTAKFDVGQGLPAADRAHALAEQGRLATSVGFIPEMAKAKELTGGDSFFSNFEFNGQELLEVSAVSVPSNPDALQRMKGVHPVIDGIVEELMGDLIFVDAPEYMVAHRVGSHWIDQHGKLVNITINEAPDRDVDVDRDADRDIEPEDDDDMIQVRGRLDALEYLLHTHEGGPDLEEYDYKAIRQAIKEALHA